MTTSRRLISSTIVTLLLFTFGISSTVSAQEPSNPFMLWLNNVLGIKTQNIVKPEIKPLLKPFNGSSQSDQIKEKVKERVGELKPNIVNKIKKLAYVAIGTGKIVSITGTSLSATDEENSKTYTILTGKFDRCTTKFIRKFGGKSDLSEYTAGDTINVVGYFTDDTKTTIQACVIRDMSIQKRRANFVGLVKVLTPNGFVMTTLSEKRADQTVSLTDSSKLVNRKSQPIVRTDILVGHKVDVRGLWNTQNNTVTQTTEVRDLSLPTISTSSGTPSPVEE